MKMIMKTITTYWITGMVALCLHVPASQAQGQHFDEARMTRDIEVAENVLATLIKHELGSERTFFGLDVDGAYQEGYGVTFRLPPDHVMPFVVRIAGNELRRATVISNGNGYAYSYDNGTAPQDVQNVVRLRDRAQVTADSARDVYNAHLLKAAQDFILDYGDILSQLKPNERIVVTNQYDRPNFYFNGAGQSRITVEGLKSDVAALRQGKISRKQAIDKLHVVNTESVDVREPDMEMLSSIFSRLYKPDLSKTYFLEGNVYYERFRDFGAVFYMQMLSSIERDMHLFSLPTVGLKDVDQKSRDQKVAELYPAFENGLKENILEYGRTVKSLGDDESLIFKIGLTQCKGCAIPATLELSIRSSVLKAFDAGKIDKNAAMEQFTIKKGPNQ